MTSPTIPRHMVFAAVGQKQRALGQVADASSETTLYTCPDLRIAKGRVLICEYGGNPATVRVRIKRDTDGDGVIDADNNGQFIVHNFPIPASENRHTVELTLTDCEIRGGAADIITVWSSTATVAFTFNGHTEPMDPSIT